MSEPIHDREDDDGIEVFLSYAHRDEALRAKLDEHLGALKYSGLIRVWSDRKISPGDTWETEILDRLESADMIIFLVSSSLLDSAYVNSQELPRALERQENGLARVVPVIIRPCFWQQTSLARLQGLPASIKPITKWRDQDEAFAEVAAGLYQIMHKVVRQRQDRQARNSAPDVSRVSKSSENVSQGSEVRKDDIIKIRTDTTPENQAFSRIETVAWETWELAVAAQEKIQQALDATRDLDALVYKRSSRIKSPARIREVLLRRRAEREQDYIASVRDACGFRLITLFQSDIPKVLSFMLRLAAHDPDLGRSPFKRDGATEVTIYTDRPSTDPLSIETKIHETIRDIGFRRDVNVRTASISQCISAIFECEVTHSRGDVVVSVEFQFRSVFEDAWGELHHKLMYAPRHSGISDRLFVMQNTHLRTLKNMLDGVSAATDVFKTFLEASEKEDS